ncbi:MAG: NAD(P)/FAD-dependent oxidoreductase [Bacteroidetes bacterium]|nr:NAD(P)/FAD-dependent oxidoreductase [Bacteroidota bacterium]
MAKIPVIIIGAGPAGLATAGRLRNLGIEFQMLEKSKNLANAWVNHYDRLHLHTIKRFSGLPHYPLPDALPEYVPKNDLVAYYQEYAAKFNIHPLFGKEVIKVSRLEKGWKTETADGSAYESKAVVVCTGFNRVPKIPDFEGMAHFSGTIRHSLKYKNPKVFQPASRTLVVGMGNTGAEIALDLAEHGVDTTMSVRSPVNIVPRDINGRPTQVTAKILDKLPNVVGDRIGRLVQKLTIGDLSEFGISRPKINPRKQLRTLAKTPVLDIGTVDKIKSGAIKVRPGISRIGENTVTFTDGREEQFDHIILATGFYALIQEFVENGEVLLNEHGYPSGPISGESHPDLYFVGFDGYSSGILESIYRDSRRVVAHMWQEKKRFLHQKNTERAKTV